MNENSADVLVLNSIVKSFGTESRPALDEVFLSVKEGTIHAIVGENAAGKTTLVRIIAGLERPDTGTILFNGDKLNLITPKSAHHFGIEIVEQEFRVAEDLTVSENIFLGNEPGKSVFINKKFLHEYTRSLAHSYGISINPEEYGRNLLVGEKQIVEILRALARVPKILILDEPTSVLNETEVERLLATVSDLRARGKTVIYVSHKLREVKKIADYVTVLRRGKVAGTISKSEFDENKLVGMMTGEDHRVLEIHRAKPSGSLLKIVDLSTADSSISGLSLEIRTGEILGIAGIKGNGQEPLLETIIGLNKIKSGTIYLLGEDVTGYGTGEMRDLGVAYVPSDRYIKGSCKELAIFDHMVPYQLNRTNQKACRGETYRK